MKRETCETMTTILLFPKNRNRDRYYELLEKAVVNGLPLDEQREISEFLDDGMNRHLERW